MKLKKLFPVALSCLLILETPVISQAAEFSQRPSVDVSLQDEATMQDDSNLLYGAGQDNTNIQGSSTQTTSKLSVNLNKSSAKLTAGSVLQLKSSVSGYDTSITDNQLQISWSSDKPDIVSVSPQGLVTAHKAGKAVITATATLKYADNTYTATSSCTVTVTNTITLNKKKLTVYTCQSPQLKATAIPSGTVKWQSSNKSVVTVSKKGKLSPLKTGSATITATTNGVSASCKITVKKPTLELESTKRVYLKNPVELDFKATPKGDITWKSSDETIAEVNSEGKVTPKKRGTVTITASFHGLKKTCKVTVRKPSVKMSTENVILFAESDHTLNASAHPSSKLTFRSSNPKVAKVSKNGRITGVRSGTATVTASVPGAKVSCEVTVLKNSHKINRSSQTLMVGASTTIYMSDTSANDNVTYELSNPSVAKLDVNKNVCTITARETGKATLHAYYTTYVDGQPVTCEQSCSIKVIGSGIVQQQEALAIGAHKTMTLVHVEKSGETITGTEWTSSNPGIATINPHSGNVTGKKYGSVKITATVSYSDDTVKEYVTSLKVSHPKTNNKNTVVSLGHSQKVSLSGLTSYSNATWKLKKKSLASIAPDGTVTAGTKTGQTTLTIEADGKTIKHTIIVTNPKLKTTSTLLAPKKTTKIKLSGVCAQSNITYHSMKKSIATVNKVGVIKGQKCGTTKIAITADGNRFTFQVDVIPQRAIDACKTGYNIMYSSSYSQARRMSKGYYDCSSLVFRSYGCDTALLGGISSWAPTAASMASYLERTGKVISYRGLDVSKLRPGDLIFYKAPYSNGRYKNIYHVSMYYGDGYRLEKPLRAYYQERNIVMIARPVR